MLKHRTKTDKVRKKIQLPLDSLAQFNPGQQDVFEIWDLKDLFGSSKTQSFYIWILWDCLSSQATIGAAHLKRDMLRSAYVMKQDKPMIK